MIRAIALDDEPLALSILANFCQQQDNITLLRTFTKPSEAADYIENFPVDLLFLDIEMPSQTGIAFYQGIAQQIPVIFTTAYNTYAVEGFNLNAIDYLLKPYAFERFSEAVQRAAQRIQPEPQPLKNDNYLMVRHNYTLVKVPLSDIILIEAFGDYLKIHRPNTKPLVVWLRMKELQEQLPTHAFMRVHRSFVIALDKISGVRNKKIFIDKHIIPIGPSYEEAFFAHYNKGD